MVGEEVQLAGTVYCSVVQCVSLSTGQFPDSFKHAIMIPLLKKYNLDKLSLKNYRPVSNLPFLSYRVGEGCPDTATVTFG